MINSQHRCKTYIVGYCPNRHESRGAAGERRYRTSTGFRFGILGEPARVFAREIAILADVQRYYFRTNL